MDARQRVLFAGDEGDEADAGVAPMHEDLKRFLRERYEKMGETVTNPTQPEWWTLANGLRKTNVMGITDYNRGSGWRVRLQTNGNRSISKTFAQACALRANLNPPADLVRRYIPHDHADAVAIPDPAITTPFASCIYEVSNNLELHHFVYEDCNGGRGTPIAHKNSATRGEIAELLCKRLWCRFDPTRHTTRPPELEYDDKGHLIGQNRRSHDFLAVVTDADGTVKQPKRIEVKLVRMDFSKGASGWRLQFNNVKSKLSDEVWLVFEGFDGMHVVVWDGETGYGRNGIREEKMGGLITVSSKSGVNAPQQAHDQLREKLFTKLTHKSGSFTPVTVAYTDAQYADVFAYASESEALHMTMPLGKLGEGVRGAMYEVLVRHVLTALGHVVTKPSLSDNQVDRRGKKRKRSSLEFDLLLDGKTSIECKGGLMNRSKGQWYCRGTHIKTSLHDALFFIAHCPKGIHIWKYHGSLAGREIDAQGQKTKQQIMISAGKDIDASAPEAAEERILRKLALIGKNNYVAHIVLNEHVHNAFEDARPRAPFGSG